MQLKIKFTFPKQYSDKAFFTDCCLDYMVCMDVSVIAVLPNLLSNFWLLLVLKKSVWTVYAYIRLCKLVYVF